MGTLKMMVSLQPVNAISSCLKWVELGSEKPTGGKELRNEKLARGLESKSSFTADELKKFGIDELQMDHWIRSGKRYLQPDDHHQKLVKEMQRRSSWVVRAYIFEVGGLDQKADPFLRLSFGNAKQDNRKDFKKDSSVAHFHQIFEFPVELPGETVLRVEAVDHSIIGNDALEPISGIRIPA